MMLIPTDQPQAVIRSAGNSSRSVSALSTRWPV